MSDLPPDPPIPRIDLIRRSDARPVVARVAILTPSMARRLIDKRWWAGLPVAPARAAAEEDQCWLWEREVSQIAEHPAFSCYVAVTGCDNKSIQAQGAMICNLQAESMREPGRPALYLQWLASNPRNRHRLLGEVAVFGRVGTGLISVALLKSYLEGFGGRVLLRPLPNSVGFYEGQKFVKVLDTKRDRIYYEMSGETACRRLRDEGLIR